MNNTRGLSASAALQRRGGGVQLLHVPLCLLEYAASGPDRAKPAVCGLEGPDFTSRSHPEDREGGRADAHRLLSVFNKALQERPLSRQLTLNRAELKPDRLYPNQRHV